MSGPGYISDDDSDSDLDYRDSDLGYSDSDDDDDGVDGDINELSANINQLDGDTVTLDHALKEHLDEDKRFFDHVQGELQEILEEITRNTRAKAETAKEMADLTDQLQINDQKIRQMTDTFNIELLKLYDKLVTDLAQITNIVDDINDDTATDTQVSNDPIFIDIKKRLDDLNATVARANVDRTARYSFEEGKQIYDTMLSPLVDDLTSIQSDLTNFTRTNSLDKYQSKLDALETEITNLKTQEAEMKDEETRLQTEINDASKGNAQLIAQLEDCKKKAKIQNRKIDELNKLVDSIIKRIRTIMPKFDDASHKKSKADINEQILDIKTALGLTIQNPMQMPPQQRAPSGVASAVPSSSSSAISLATPSSSSSANAYRMNRPYVRPNPFLTNPRESFSAVQKSKLDREAAEAAAAASSSALVTRPPPRDPNDFSLTYDGFPASKGGYTYKNNNKRKSLKTPLAKGVYSFNLKKTKKKKQPKHKKTKNKKSKKNKHKRTKSKK